MIASIASEDWRAEAETVCAELGCPNFHRGKEEAPETGGLGASSGSLGGNQ